ncbi:MULTISPECIES: NemA protein [unclassified Neisseria]|uniref:NemA protein n=1 Tax=unclassified Neisseria TaxID=2623750 RepID=UPI001071D527|nr:MULTISPECIES: NemA protein [unclassified Neisseria]MBF0804738.1 NemA protein [Neisseria sp. 19428wB4_WF04]TFU40230.1 NemA protein [Neisseria sp. WF04]
MKHILFAATLATLSACTVGTPGMSVGVGVGTSIGRHVGLGTSINIPVGLDRTRTGGNKDGTNVVEEQTVTYFDAQGNARNQPVKGGFHRQLVGRRSNEYIVQDFYSDNNQKRTDPYTLPRSRLMDFRAHPENGALTTYAYNGNMMQQQIFKNGKLVNAKY